jgi:hypothetical protein
LSALIIDREDLLPCGVGWNSGFYALFPDHLELIDTDLTDSGETSVVRQRIIRFARDNDQARLRSSTASFLVDIFPDPVLPHSLATHLGDLPYESVRIFILFMANMMQRTYFRSTALKCPFCPSDLSSMHLFSCSGVQRNPVCDWGAFVQNLLDEMFHDAIDRLFLVLQRWNILTNHFTPGFHLHVNEYFEYTTFGSRRRNSIWLSASQALNINC